MTSSTEVLQILDHAVSALTGKLAAASTVEGRFDSEAYDRVQVAAYELAFAAAEVGAIRSVLGAAERGVIGTALAAFATDLLARSARHRIDGLGMAIPTPSQPFADLSAKVADPGLIEDVASGVDDGRRDLSDELRMLAAEFRRFGEGSIAPHAEEIHRRDLDIPESIIAGIGALGAFGMSIPEEYGGSFDPAAGHLAMVVATEELSRFSLAAGGSLLTRPEILARAILVGGTEEQRSSLLPRIASGEALVAVAATEPDAGSDVAAFRCVATRTGTGWRLDGTKTWCTFAGRADLLMVLARTDEGAGSGHRGLSLFVVSKPPCPGHEFALDQPSGGRMTARAIPTIGYRGMHSFEVVFDGWEVGSESLVGGPEGLGRGFYLQMEGFASGRLQTAARAVGLMDAAVDLARGHARERRLFGARLIDMPLTRRRLAEMVAKTVAARLSTYQSARLLDTSDGNLGSAMVKALSCRFAESVTRDAQQVFGGYGYADEYPVSRLFVDGRVLSIFEGAEEVLAVRVIGRDLVSRAVGG